MTETLPRLFDPCSLDESEQIPAKIWELLRRNSHFCALVRELSALDAKERKAFAKSGKRHGTAWLKSWRLVERIARQHPFAGFALQWLVPEPLFHCKVVAWPRGRNRRRSGAFEPQIVREGEGLTPNAKDKAWIWRNPESPGAHRHKITRGPNVYWITSKCKMLSSRVNPIEEWREYVWPFTVEHSWANAPAGFKREFHFIWRSRFDSRPNNPLTNDRRDSPSPHEITGAFRDRMMKAKISPNSARDVGAHEIHFRDVADDFRVFAIPKAILTKASAESMGNWLSTHFKRGSDLHGNLLKHRLLSEGEMLGTGREWKDWLRRRSGLTDEGARDTHYYRRCNYISSLISLVYPEFEVSKLLALPAHRARGKKYVRK